jgi:hypothetical protein
MSLPVIVNMPKEMHRRSGGVAGVRKDAGYQSIVGGALSASACLSARVVPVDKRDFTAKPVPLLQRQRLNHPPLRVARTTVPKKL